MTNKVVTLTTDFGTRDPYVGMMKGVLLDRCPEVKIVDISHQVPPGDTLFASLALHQAFPYFPAGTVHVVVVDPGVGTDRRILAAKADGQFFLAPDTGIVPAVIDPFQDRGGPGGEFRSLDPSRHGLPTVSRTFHGRDLFSPAAAALASGMPFREMGPTLDDPIISNIPSPVSGGGTLGGSVLHVDRFGNLVTNFREKDLPSGPWRLAIGETKVCSGATFSAVAPGDLVAYVGSGGFVEVAARDGDAADVLCAERETPVSIEEVS